MERSGFLLPVDVAITAVGTGANPPLQATTPDMQTNKRGGTVANLQTLRATKPSIFAGGGTVSGSATVNLAMEAGRTAASSIHDYLTTGIW